MRIIGIICEIIGIAGIYVIYPYLSFNTYDWKENFGESICLTFIVLVILFFSVELIFTGIYFVV